MNQTTFDVGDAVRIISGQFKGEEGRVDDIQSECSAVRIHTETGNAYALVGSVERIVKPRPPRRTSPIKK